MPEIKKWNGTDWEVLGESAGALKDAQGTVTAADVRANATGLVAHKADYTTPHEYVDSVSGKRYRIKVNGGVLALEQTYPHINILYNEGIGSENWVEGYKVKGSAEKNEDHFYLDGFDFAESSLVTNQMVDLTSFSTLSVDWLLSGGMGSAYLVISPTKVANYNDFTTRIVHNGTSTRNTQAIDVTSLTGNFYIRVHGYGGYETSYKLSVYGVFIE